MRVTNLQLENFRKHQNSTLAIGNAGFVVIRGKNFSGKTSIGQGISMCLTPTTTALDPQGKGFASKIKRGASKAVITADIQGKRHLIRRVVTLNTNKSSRTQHSICLSDPEWNVTAFDKQLESNRAALIVALNTEAFLRMDEREQKNLLARLVLPASYEFDQRIVESVDRVLETGTVAFGGEPFAVIQQAYQKLFDERQIVNRQVRDFVVPDPLPAPAGVDSQAIQDRLTTLRVERRGRQESRDEAVAVAAKVEAEREQIKAKKQKLLPDDRLANIRTVAAGKPELDRLLKEKKRVEDVIDEALRQAARLEELPEAGTPCPTCDQLIDPDKLAAMTAKLAEQIHQAKNENQVLFDAIRALGDVTGAVELLKAHETAFKELPPVEPDPVLFDFQPYNQSLGEIDAEIDRLNLQLRPVIAAEERAKEIIIKTGQLTRLKEKAVVLDTLVKYFDKDGIKAKLLSQYIGGFETRVNEVLGAWGYECSLSIEPYSFNVKDTDGDVNPVRELSGAERVMFSLAFQCAVSRTAGLGMVVIDEVGMLLPELRPMMNQRLYQMVKEGYLEQVILLVADTSDQVPKLPGGIFFTVNHGTVHLLGHG